MDILRECHIVEVLTAYLNSANELTRLGERLSELVLPPHPRLHWPTGQMLD